MKWYRLIPSGIRRRLTSSVYELQKQYKATESAAIPVHNLERKHIANLRTLADRDQLLEMLPHGAIVAEIGVDHGDFSQDILRIAKPQKLHLIDLWGDERYHDGLAKHVTNRFAEATANGVLQIHRGYSHEVLATFPDAYFDWIYIDTDHTYETTKKELEVGARKVKAGGIIAGHDFVTGNWNRWIRYGVVEAVHEFCVKHDWELIFLTCETHRHLSFAIRKL